MRILLVTFSNLLPAALNNVLNPALEYCAIVVDEPEPAKKFFYEAGLDSNLIYPFYELKECIADFYYDFLLCVSDGRQIWDLHKNFKMYGLPKNKFVYFFLNDNNFLVKRALQYYEKHSAEFEIFATGSSYTAMGLDAHRFKYKLFNLGSSGQDLYYDYQIAKYILSKAENKFRYALIGLAPHSFHCDISKTYAFNWRLSQYFIALKDLHNFWLPAEDYQKIFRQEYLSSKIFIDNLDVNNIYLEKNALRFIDCNARIEARKKIDLWKSRTFPETRTENIKTLENYLSLCENCKVKAIIFLPPMTEGYMKYSSRQKLDEFYYIVQTAQKKFSSAVFFDGWKLKAFDDTNFWDVNQLNIKGAAKFSAILNNFIETLEK